MKEAIIIFMVLLLLLLIISVFGGSIRYTTPAVAAPRQQVPPVFGLYDAAGRHEAFSQPKRERFEEAAAAIKQAQVQAQAQAEPEEDSPTLAPARAISAAPTSEPAEQVAGGATIEPFHGGEFASY